MKYEKFKYQEIRANDIIKEKYLKSLVEENYNNFKLLNLKEISLIQLYNLIEHKIMFKDMYNEYTKIRGKRVKKPLFKNIIATNIIQIIQELKKEEKSSKKSNQSFLTTNIKSIFKKSNSEQKNIKIASVKKSSNNFLNVIYRFMVNLPIINWMIYLCLSRKIKNIIMTSSYRFYISTPTFKTKIGNIRIEVSNCKYDICYKSVNGNIEIETIEKIDDNDEKSELSEFSKERISVEKYIMKHLNQFIY